MSARSMFKAKPVKKDPRSIEDINKEYTAYAQLLGDKYVKIEGLKRDVEQVMVRINQLGAELTERQKLDKETADVAKPAEEVKS